MHFRSILNPLFWLGKTIFKLYSNHAQTFWNFIMFKSINIFLIFRIFSEKWIMPYQMFYSAVMNGFFHWWQSWTEPPFHSCISNFCTVFLVIKCRYSRNTEALITFFWNITKRPEKIMDPFFFPCTETGSYGM